MSFPAADLGKALELQTPGTASGFVVAVSGGADSAALLAAAASLAATTSLDPRIRGLAVRAVHIDHGLQPAARALRDACAAACSALGIALTVISVSVACGDGESIEEAARDARYAALAADLAAGECLMTAHHREDQAETLLLQALRGAGLPGLSGMPVRRVLGKGWHLRPLLDVPRRELRAYGVIAGASFARDPMNDDPRFDRGYLRRRIWPLLEARWPAAGAALSRTAAHLGEAQSLLDDAAGAEVGRLRDGDALSLPGLRALSEAQRMSALRCWLRESGVEPPSTARLTEALRQMLESQADRLPSIVWGRWALRRYRQRVFITPASPPQLEAPRRWSPAGEPQLALGAGLGEIRLRPQRGGIDAARLPEILTVRRREGGETLRPGARANTQTLQHLCQSQGVLPWMRAALPLLFAGDELIAVADLWRDARWCSPAGAPGVIVEWRRAPIIV
jgi:tRNA(Ile)-lysidine synthase